jgi:flagellar FliL protein
MGDEELGQDFEDAGGGGGGKKGLPLFVYIIIIAVIMGAAGFFAGKIFSGGENNKEKAAVEKTEKQEPADTKDDQKEKTEEDTTEADSGEKTEEDDGTLVSKSKAGILVLDPFTVNLNDPFGRRYIEVVVNLEISNKVYVSKINENELMKPRMRDEIFMIISAKSYNELRSTSGRVTLKEEIMMRVNELMKEEFDKEPVTRVYFTKFIIQ